MSATAQRAQEPALSPVQSALIAVFKPRTTQSANESGAVAKGTALAEMILRDANARMLKGKAFLRNIADLDNPGRKAMRVAFTEYLAAFRDEAKQWKDTDQAPLFASRINVLGRQTSEYVAFSKACDMGWHEIDWTLGYPELMAAARCVRDATANMLPDGVEGVGPTVRRGRKAKTLDEKFSAYVLSLNPTQADLEGFSKIIRAAIKAAKDAQATEVTERRADAPVEVEVMPLAA
jgi:hypothetical protein